MNVNRYFFETLFQLLLMMLYMNGPKDTWQDIETFKEKVNNLEEMQKSVHRHELLQRKNYVGTLVLIMHVIC